MGKLERCILTQFFTHSLSLYLSLSPEFVCPTSTLLIALIQGAYVIRMITAINTAQAIADLQTFVFIAPAPALD